MNNKRKEKKKIYLCLYLYIFLVPSVYSGDACREVDARCSQRKKKEERMDKVWSFFLV